VQGLEAIGSSPPSSARPWAARLVPLTSVLLLLGFIGGSALLYLRSLRSPRTIPGIRIGASQLGAALPEDLDQVIRDEAERFVDGTITLQVGTTSRTAQRRALGVRVEIAETRARLAKTGKTGDFLRDLVDRVQARRGRLRVPLHASLDRDVALDYFTRLKEQVDRLPVASRLDLDKAAVVPGVEGYQLHVYDCLAATELALARDDAAVRLAVTVSPPTGGGERLKGLDISHVLGQFTTVYSLADKDADRAHNLKVGASKLDGAVIDPGGRLSFNEKVGKRTEAEGYRTAPVITEGELVDGMAGGACQLSSTLFAASFFAGLELESSRPHTRPSSYIKMGLDAAVAYPSTDLVLKNPYTFPVVLHYKVTQGKVTVRILGNKRPWRKVVFEREIKETIPFKTEVRRVGSIPKGYRFISQVGVPGFRLERRRLFYGEERGKVVKEEKREIRYPSTTQFITEGTGPANPAYKPPHELKPFGEVPQLYKVET
jgi:vancomycin resistance protein YoaR